MLLLSFIAVLAVYQVLLFFVHAAVYKLIVIAFGWNWVWLAWVFGILSISFVVSSLLTQQFKNRLVVWYYRISAYWFGLIHFLFVGAFVFYLLEVILYSSDDYISPAILGAITLGAAFLIHTYATWQTLRPKITRIAVKLQNLPEFWQGKKIVFVSDIHLGAIWSRKLSEKIAAIVRAESPESVWIGGDLFDGVRCHSEEALRPLAALRLPQGIYYITGNHEYYRDTEEFLAAIRASGIRILDDKLVDLHGLQLVGIDWKNTHSAEDCRKVLAQVHIDRARPAILLKHEPNDLSISESAGISLQLSGHTHQGQIFPLSLVTRRIYNGFDYGLKKLGNMLVYTSSGIGTWGPPLRFGTKSEIVVITLNKN